MRIDDEFRVTVPVDEAWAVLLDLERIAPCLPGAQLQEIEDDEYRGVVKVKVGPISAQYKGSAKLDAINEANRTVVIRAVGRDTRGAGNASATITAKMRPDGDGTLVSLETDLAITGKVAQFGRGVLADVSAKLVSEFVANLEANVLGGDAAEAASEIRSAGDPADNGGVRRVDAPEAEPVDLVDAAGDPIAKRLWPAVGGFVAVVLLWRWWRRRTRRGAARVEGDDA